MHRRGARLRRAWRTLSGPASNPWRAVVAPQVQLLCKSAAPRAKDEADFARVAGVLDDVQRGWLVEALRLTDPVHPWIERLRATAAP